MKKLLLITAVLMAFACTTLHTPLPPPPQCTAKQLQSLPKNLYYCSCVADGLFECTRKINDEEHIV